MWVLIILSCFHDVVAADSSCSAMPNEHTATGKSLIQTSNWRRKQILDLSLREKLDIPPIFYGYVAHRATKESMLLQLPIIDSLSLPSDEPYSLDAGDDHFKGFSQWGQDKLLDEILSQVKNGFFVESGARDGEEHSNSLWYEMRGWNGLLVEPSQQEFPRLLGKHRKAYAFHGCLSPTGTSEFVHFLDSGDGESRIENSSSFTVPCEPLAHLLGAIKQTTVDFWSLDIEGSEGAVLKATDFNKIEVGVLLIEMNKGAENNKVINGVMKANDLLAIGTTSYPDGILDHVFVNPSYFRKRNLSVPTATPASWD